MVALNRNTIDKNTNHGKALLDLEDRVITLEGLDESTGGPTVLAEIAMDNTSPPTATAGQGAVVGSGNEGLVAQLAVAAMAVRVQLGGVAINNQGLEITIPTTTSLAVAASDVTNARQDIVVVTKDGALAIRTGTPSGSPADPTLTAGDVPLARLAVAANAVSVLTANITDLRSRGGVTGAKLTGASVTGAKLATTGIRFIGFTGHNLAGPCTLTGAVVGDRVIGVIQTDATDVAAAAKFESVITVADQIQQSAASDLSTHRYAVILVAKAA